MHPVDLFASLLASSDVWLIGDYDKHESQFPQADTRFDDAGQQAQLLDSPRRMGGAVVHIDVVEHAVAVEEDGGAGSGQRPRVGHSSNLPARASGTIAAIESRSASLHDRSFFHPR